MPLLTKFKMKIKVPTFEEHLNENKFKSELEHWKSMKKKIEKSIADCNDEKDKTKLKAMLKTINSRIKKN